MITKFDKYVKEYTKKYGFSGNDYNEIIKYFSDIYKYRNYIVINEFKEDKTIYIDDIDTDETIIYIIIKNNKIKYGFFKNIYKNEVDDYFKFIQDIEEQCENFYELLKTNKIYSMLRNFPKEVINIPVLNLEKYCDFIIYCSKEYNPDILLEFIDVIYNNKNYKDIKEEFDKKYKHLINANNFDLL